QVLNGCPKADDIGNREEAIAAAVANLEAGDILMIAGKGHETGQIIGSETRPFDDAEVARKVILGRGGEVVE
ncbi:MAG: UDP-N-acetylmuramoyl-L-alanyl-D-glutamate--2,6-diaminopimelate ligase, partial [Alphaproteobacteria bacterium]